MAARALITGNSRGLGLGLTETLLGQGWQVFGLSRGGCPLQHPALRDARADLADFTTLASVLQGLLSGVERLDLAVLNAGSLGELRDLRDAPLEDMLAVMDVNVWANKVLIDWLLAQGLAPAQLVLISSGAAVNGHRGWGAYALSKASLNMLARLYAREMPESHVCALAPGLVDTAMQAYLCDAGQVDAERFPSVERLRAARGTPAMPGPAAAAAALVAALGALRARPSGSYVDLRDS